MPAGSTITCLKLRSVRPAPTSSSEVHATSAMIKPNRSRRRRLTGLRPPSLSEFRRIIADEMPGWQHAGEQSGRQTHCGREQEYRHTENDRTVRPNRRRHLRRQQLHAPYCNDQAGGAAGEREQRRFDEHLADQAPSARADRRPHCDLPLATGGLRQQQVRHVDAGDQEDEANRRHQHDQHALRTALTIFRRKRRHMRAVTAAQFGYASQGRGRCDPFLRAPAPSPCRVSDARRQRGNARRVAAPRNPVGPRMA